MKDIYRYGRDLNSHDLVKIVAITTMVIDHIGLYFLGNNVWFRIVGRLAAPQFFYLVGYSGSYRFKREILAYGLALIAVEYFAGTGEGVVERLLPINILVAFVLIKAFLGRFDLSKFPTAALFGALLIMFFMSYPTWVAIEYGTIGLCYAIGARLQSKNHSFALPWLSATVLLHYVFSVFTLPGLEFELSVDKVIVELALLAFLFIGNLILFTNYRFRVFEVRPQWLKTIGIYVSRYSLDIYFFHLSAFMIIHKLWIA
jgi:hypothetical protein